MVAGKSSKLWMVNLTSFILFAVLCVTGLLNWLVLPRGYEARGSLLVSARHLLIAVHEWAALIFIIVVVIHIKLHWPYVKNNLQKTGIMKGKTSLKS